ncbi:MAG TPA: SAVED domain-containing protein [Candidatus Udaeobacter sp.]|nr:SAVED domain-containing protein [Candidatus Udaeobacter sp.]
MWGRAAGRCEFSDCNRLLYKSSVTQERVNIAQMAHIYSFSAAGPRGRGPYSNNTEGLNDTCNLMLVCYDCHRKIDQDKGGSRYSAMLLKSWKEAHEFRIRVVTDIKASKKSHVLLYGSRVGDERSPLNFNAAAESMFPDWFPADDRPINLSMACSHDDSAPEFWASEAAHLQKEFERQVRNRSEEANPNHFSVYALASQPLLTLLGSLLTDKVPASVYQLHREPRTWKWQPHPENFVFEIVAPDDKTGTPVLVIALSAAIEAKRVSSVISGPLAIWQLTIGEPHNDFLKSEAQLSMFRQAARKMISKIEAAHPEIKELPIFPAMPIACAIELGRIRMPKANRPWHLYDQNNKQGNFIPALKIGTSHE